MKQITIYDLLPLLKKGIYFLMDAGHFLKQNQSIAMGVNNGKAFILQI